MNDNRVSFDPDEAGVYASTLERHLNSFRAATNPDQLEARLENFADVLTSYRAQAWLEPVHRYVAHTSQATLLVQTVVDSIENPDVVLLDRDTNTVMRFPVDSDGQVAWHALSDEQRQHLEQLFPEFVLKGGNGAPNAMKNRAYLAFLRENASAVPVIEASSGIIVEARIYWVEIGLEGRMKVTHFADGSTKVELHGGVKVGASSPQGAGNVGSASVSGGVQAGWTQVLKFDSETEFADFAAKFAQTTLGNLGAIEAFFDDFGDHRISNIGEVGIYVEAEYEGIATTPDVVGKTTANAQFGAKAFHDFQTGMSGVEVMFSASAGNSARGGFSGGGSGTVNFAANGQMVNATVNLNASVTDLQKLVPGIHASTPDSVSVTADFDLTDPTVYDAWEQYLAGKISLFDLTHHARIQVDVGDQLGTATDSIYAQTAQTLASAPDISAGFVKVKGHASATRNVGSFIRPPGETDFIFIEPVASWAIDKVDGASE